MLGIIGKVANYGIHLEFQVSGLPQVHNFFWILNSPKLSNKTIRTRIKLIHQVFRANIPSHEDYPSSYELVELGTIH